MAQTSRRIVVGALCVLLLALVACAAGQHPASTRCPDGMAFVEPPDGKAFCIDRWEASLVEITPAGERDFSPFENVGKRKVRAVSRPGVVPQAYISRNEADVACRASRKRLCEEDEWVRACEGAERTTFPYGEKREAGYCNDHGKSPIASLYADNAHTWEAMNDPRLDQQPETVAKTGTYSRCKSSYGAFDMVGNVHEWVADPDGTFLGGYYLDTTLNGNGCHYKTVAHDAVYHDYSTGFRCCADAR
ncbi:MAG: formylglycine-generating enzyme family protein [Polyangiaceae bacterium]